MNDKTFSHFKFTLPILKTRIAVEKIDGKDKEVRYVEGIASSTDLDLHGDRMDPSAIKTMADSLKFHLVSLNADHDTTWSAELGDISKLDVSESNQLLIEARLNEMSKAEDLWLALTKMEKKLGLSIGGYVKEYEMVKEELKNEENGKIEEKWVKHYKDIELDHIAVTSSPANPKTWVGAIAKSIEKDSELIVKSLEEKESEKKAAEQAEKDKKTKKFKDIAHEIVGQIRKMEDNLLLELTEKALNYMSEDQLLVLETNLSMVQKNSLEAEEVKKTDTEVKEPEKATVETPATPETELKEEPKKDAPETPEVGAEEAKPTEEKAEKATPQEGGECVCPSGEKGHVKSGKCVADGKSEEKSEEAGDTTVKEEKKVEEPEVKVAEKSEDIKPEEPSTEKPESATAELLKTVSEQVKQVVQVNETLTNRIEELEKEPAGRKTVEAIDKGVGDEETDTKDAKTLKKEMDAKIAEVRKTHAMSPNLFSLIQKIRAEYGQKV